MNKEKDHIKNLFSSKLKNFEETPPSSLWNRIDLHLSKQQVPFIKKRTTPMGAIFATLSAAAILGIVFFIYPKNDIADTFATLEQLPEWSFYKQNQLSRESTKQHLSNNIYTDIRHTNQHTSSYYSRVAINKSITIPPYNNSPILLIDQKSEKEKKNIDNFSNIISTSNRNKKNNSDLNNKIEAFIADGQNNNSILKNVEQNFATSKTQSQQGFEIGLAGGGTFSKTTQIENKLRLYTLKNTGSKEDMIIDALKNRRMKLIHNQPINIGINFNKKLNNKLSLETGILYTYLSSKMKSIDNISISSKDALQFHYIGIPLSINYEFAQWNKFKFYASAGITAQKDFYGRLKTDQDFKQTNKMRSKHISQKHIQFSVNSGIGASYPIYKTAALFSTIGAAHYIDAKNQYETVFSDRKWQLNINIGLKLGF